MGQSVQEIFMNENKLMHGFPEVGGFPGAMSPQTPTPCILRREMEFLSLGCRGN